MRGQISLVHLYPCLTASTVNIPLYCNYLSLSLISHSTSVPAFYASYLPVRRQFSNFLPSFFPSSEAPKVIEPLRRNSNAQKVAKKRSSSSHVDYEKRCGNSDTNSNDIVNELPKFDLGRLGLSKEIKLVVYVLLGIYGTVETVIWTLWIMRWWNNRTEVD